MTVGERRDRLLRELREVEAELPAQVGRLAPADLAAGRYESGWNGRQIVAHLASMEWTYPRLIEMARGVVPPPPRTLPTGGAPIDGYNARQVERRAAVPLGELLEEFRRNRARLIRAVAGMEESLLDVPVRAAGGTAGTLEAVLRFAAVEHVRGHLADLRGAGGGR